MQNEQILSDKHSFIWPIRVYYEDTDCGGVVYHSNYLKFMEQARTEWLRHLGLEQDILINDYGIIFAVRSLSIDYLKPALFNQSLKVETIIEKMGKVSLFFKQLIYCEQHPQNKQLLSSANVKVVCLAYDQKLKKIIGPKKLPEEIYQRLQIADRNKKNHA